MRSGRAAPSVRRQRGFLVSTSENNSDADRFSASRSTHPSGSKVARRLSASGEQKGPNARGADLCVPGAQRGVYAGKVFFWLALLRTIPTRIASPCRDLPIRPLQSSNGADSEERSTRVCILPEARRSVFLRHTVVALRRSNFFAPTPRNHCVVQASS